MRHDAAIPQRAFVRAVTTALFRKLRGGPVGVVADGFHRAIRKVHRFLRRVGRAHHVQRVLEAHDAKTHGAMLQVRRTRFFYGVVVNVNYVVEHAHRGANGFLQLDLIENEAAFAVINHVINEVH